MNPPICDRCAHAYGDPDSKMLHCRRFPPAVFPVVGQHPMTGAPTLQVVSQFPTVAREATCGEHVPQRLIAS